MPWNAKPFAVTVGILAVAVGAARSVHALPVPAPPRSATATGSPSAVPAGATLPIGTSLLFVLDDAVNSASTPAGTTIRMHLRSPLIVNGITLAAAGTPGSFSVLSTHKAQSGDIDGSVQIYVNPIALPGRNITLPLRAVHEYLSREMSAGQLSTRQATDTATDVFVPYAFLYQILRKGHQMVMPVGTILRTETAATIDASNPANVVLATPPPFVRNYDPPHADLTPAPLFTPAARPPHPLQKGKPTVPPRSPAPSPSPSPAPSPSVTGSAAAPPPAMSAGAPSPAMSAGAPSPAVSAGVPSPAVSGGQAAPGSGPPAPASTGSP